MGKATSRLSTSPPLGRMSETTTAHEGANSTCTGGAHRGCSRQCHARKRAALCWVQRRADAHIPWYGFRTQHVSLHLTCDDDAREVAEGSRMRARDGRASRSSRTVLRRSAGVHASSRQRTGVHLGFKAVACDPATGSDVVCSCIEVALPQPPEAREARDGGGQNSTGGVPPEPLPCPAWGHQRTEDRGWVRGALNTHTPLVGVSYNTRSSA